MFDKLKNLPAKVRLMIGAGGLAVLIAVAAGYWFLGRKTAEPEKRVTARPAPVIKLPPGIIVYTSHGKIWKLVKGEEPMILLEGMHWFPALNAGGTQLAYWEDAGTSMSLYVMNLISTVSVKIGEWRTLGDKGRNLSVRNAPCWDPKQDLLYFADGIQIWSVNSDGTNLETMYRHPSGNCYSVTVAPDGKTFAFVSVTEYGQNLWTYSLVSKRTEMLTEDTYQAGAVGAPAWSPKGTSIVYVVYKAEEVNLWSVASDGGVPIRLTKKGRTNSPQWGPFGRKLVVSSGSQDPLHWQIWLMDGRNWKYLKQLTDVPAGAYAPSISGRW